MPRESSKIKVSKSVSIRKDLAEEAQGKADQDNRSFSNYLETLIQADMDRAQEAAPVEP
jgi:hypothetical protein